MFVRRVRVQGFRAAAADKVVCDFPGRFYLLLGANNAGKTIIAEALYLAHPQNFPSLPRPTSALLGRSDPREVEVEFQFADPSDIESSLGQGLRDASIPPPTWTRQLERNLGQIRARALGPSPEALDNLRLIYLPASRNPLDELARREARILVELLRAEQQQLHGHRNLVDIRNSAVNLHLLKG